MKLIKVDTKVSEARKIVNSGMKDVTPEEAFKTLIVGAETEKLGNKIFSRSKNYIENNLVPDDVVKILDESKGTKLIGQFESYETLFGVEYNIGGLEWKVKKGTKKGIAYDIAVNSEYKEKLEELGIIQTTLVVNYEKIHKYLSSHTSITTIPKELYPLIKHIELVTTDKTVNVSTIKNKAVTK